MTQPASGNAGTQVTDTGLVQMQQVHQRNLDDLTQAVVVAQQVVDDLHTVSGPAANPFGGGDDGTAAFKLTYNFATAVLAALKREQQNLETLWGDFQTWARLTSGTDHAMAQAISATAPQGGQ